MSECFKKIISHIYILTIAIGPYAIRASSDYDETLSIYEKAIHSSTFIEHIHEEGIARRELESSILQQLSTIITSNASSDHEKLRECVIQSLENEKQIFINLYTQLEDGQYRPGDNKGTTYQLLSNKMSIKLDFALELARDKKTFYSILEGKYPEGYSIHVPQMNFYPNDNHIFSNGKRGNALKILLTMIYLEQNKDLSLARLANSCGTSLDEHPFMHITPLPNDFDVTDVAVSQYFYNDYKTPQGIIMIHNGYAFGGHRREPRYPNGQKNGPHDCSSFVAKQTGCVNAYSTLDQTFLFQAKHGLAFSKLDQDIIQEWHQNLLPDWQKKDLAKEMDTLYAPLNRNIEPQNLKAGLVHVERFYKNIKGDSKLVLKGSGGHTGFFVGILGSGADTKALTIGTNRNLEDDGREFIYGIEKRLIISNSETQVMLFDIKNKMY